jgi:PAS domain S-box-containing protein
MTNAPDEPAEFAIRRRDGSNITVSVGDTPAFADDGSVAAIMRVSRDVFDMRAIEHSLAATEAHFRALVENSADIMAVTDVDAVILTIAGPVEEILGLSADDLIGVSMFDFVRPVDVARARSLWSTRMTTRGRMHAEDFWTQRLDGGWVCLSVMTTNCLDDSAIAGMVVTVRDVTRNRNHESGQGILRAASAALMLARSERDLFDEICRVIVAEEPYELAWIGVGDNTRSLGFRVLSTAGNNNGYVEAVEWAFEHRTIRGAVVEVLESGHPIIVQDVETMPKTNPFRQILLDHGYRSSVLLPLPFGESDIGVIGIYSRRPGAFGDDAVDILNTLAGDIVFGIDAIRTRAAHDEYRARYEASLGTAVGAIATAAELRDPYTAGHQRRVARLAEAIAVVLGVENDLVAGIGVAASIHDIGKLIVPSQILSKPGPLTETEFELVKEHAQAGYDVVAGIDFPWPAADMILQHHERLDGSGYPNGLHDAEIGLGGRIIAVADVVEALMSHRPYRPALGIDVAVGTIAHERGKLLCADAVDACLRLLADGGSILGEPD